MNRITERRSVLFAGQRFVGGVAALALVLTLGASAAGCAADDPATDATITTAGSTTSDLTTPGSTSTTLAAPTSTATAGSTLPPAGDPSATTVTYSPPYTGTTQPGIPLPPFESNALAKELKRTSLAAAQLGAKMEADHTPQDDPSVAVIFALRARAQALTARRAIVDRAMPLADLASAQIAPMLARAAAVAEGDAAAAIAQAQSRLEALTVPSAQPAEAASALDYVIRDLAPLVP